MNKRTIITISCLTLMMIILISCAPKAAAPEMMSYAVGNDMSAAPMASPMAIKEAPGESDSMMESAQMLDEEISSSVPSTDQRIVIMNASISVIVKDPAIAMDSITKMANEMGGFIVNSNLYKTYTEDGVEVPEATITVRVPSEKLNIAMDQIKGLVEDSQKDIRSENIQGSDVTREYTDLQSRLKNLENTETRLLEIMDSAVKTQDVLAVHNELTQVGEQIEVIKGQIKYYDEASALSAIDVNIVAQESIEPLTVGGWEPKGIAQDALQSLVDALKSIATAAIWIVLFVIPVLIIIAIPFVAIFFIIRWIIRSIKRKNSDKSLKDKGKITPLEEKIK